MDKTIQALKNHKLLIFPGIVALFIVVMSALQISGTSSGVFDYYLGVQDTNRISGEPRSVRSDEWAVNTPFIAAQYENGFPTLNQNIGSGQDMALVVDVPYSDWSILFKPQNWAFFVSPIENAFAFKWWFLAGILVLSVYYFILLIYPKRILLATLVSLFFLFSPFIQWWYQSITILPIAFGLLTLISTIYMLRSTSLKKASFFAALTAYLGTCFVLVMYPAFQITIGIILIGLLVSILCSQKELNLLLKKRNLLLILFISTVIITVVGAFVLQHLDGIKATLDTVYPGSRNIQSGGMSVFTLLTWPLSFLLLNSETAQSFNANQSEASNFLLVGYVLLPFLVFIHMRNRRVFTRLEKMLLLVIGFISVILAVRMFVPIGSELFNLIGLSKVPHIRLLIGLGVINLIIIAIAVGRDSIKLHNWKEIFSVQQLLFLVIICAIYALLITTTVHHFMLDSIGLRKIMLLVIAFSVPSAFLLSKDVRVRYIALALLVFGGVVSSAMANPLQRGLSSTSNPLVSYVKNEEQKNNFYWAANENPQISSLLVSAGAEVIGGVNTYPQKQIWEKIAPSQEDVYNRYAHVRFLFNEEVAKPRLELIQSDSFYVHISPCDQSLKSLKVGYVVSETPISGSCFVSEKSFLFGAKRMFVYELDTDN